MGGAAEVNGAPAALLVLSHPLGGAVAPLLEGKVAHCLR